MILHWCIQLLVHWCMMAVLFQNVKSMQYVLNFDVHILQNKSVQYYTSIDCVENWNVRTLKILTIKHWLLHFTAALHNKACPSEGTWNGPRFMKKNISLDFKDEQFNTDHFSLIVVAVIWLKYVLYDLKHQTINQSHWVILRYRVSLGPKRSHMCYMID